MPCVWFDFYCVDVEIEEIILPKYCMTVLARRCIDASSIKMVHKRSWFELVIIWRQNSNYQLTKTNLKIGIVIGIPKKIYIIERLEC